MGLRVLVVAAVPAGELAALVPADHTVEHADSVADAVAAIDRFDSVDCVVTDHDPTEVDALAVTDAIADRAPVVVATANGSESLASDTVAAGATEYVPTTCSDAADRLNAAIRRAVPDLAPRHARLAEQFATVVETVPEGVFVLDAHGTIVGGNGTAAELAGAAPEHLVGVSIPELVADSVFDPTVIERYDEIVADLREGTGDGTGSFQFEASPGVETRTYEARVALLDVTEREARRTELERYEAVIASLADPVWTVDADGYGTYVNPAYEERFGWGQDAIDAGEVHYTDTLTDESVDRVREVTDEMLAPEGPDRATVEVEMVTADGHTVPVEDHLALLPTDGEFRGMAGISRDVSDRKRRERRLQVLRRVLRHNLGNDVTVVRGYAELLAEDAVDPTQVERAETIRSVADRLVDASRKVRQLEAIIDHDPGDRRALDASALVDAAVEQVGGRFPAAEFSVDRPDDLYVSGHEGLQHAVEQVIENAVEHNDSETPTVVVSVVREDESVVFTVEDDGPGTPRQARRIVDDLETTPVEHGTGVGLWVIKLVVESLDGELSIDDRDEGGSVVRLRLPGT